MTTHTARKTHTTTTAPLRRVDAITVSDEHGTALNPNYFWLTWEYTLSLECGHTQVRARCAYNFDPAPDKLDPPLPKRIRCTACSPIPSRSRPRKHKPDPVFDPVVGNLVAAMCKAAPDQQDSLLEWVDRHGRYVPDEARRHRSYAAMALRAIDTYLPDTRNAHASAIRTAVARWADTPTDENRAEVRRAARRLYNAQRRDGDWYAHRGIIDAAKLASPHPHNVAGVVSCPTWDHATRSDFYNKLWAIRHEYDEVRDAETSAFLDDDGDSVRVNNAIAEDLTEEISQTASDHWPTLGQQHLELAASLLTAYQDAIQAEPGSQRRPRGRDIGTGGSAR